MTRGPRVARDAFGLSRVVYARAGAAALWSSSIRALLETHSALLERDVARDVDVEALRAHLDGTEDRSRTFMRAVREVPPGCALDPVDGTLHASTASDDGTLHASTASDGNTGNTGADLMSLVRRAVERALDDDVKTAVALSGGLDSAMVLALVHELAGDRVPAYVLAPRMPGYAETDAALRTAERCGAAEVVVVDVGVEQFREALPRAVRAMECPLYNAHPVAKLLLAERLRDDGFARVITGDGADHVMKRDRSADYLPLVRSAFDAAGVELRAPFLDDDVVAHLLTLPPDPEKRALREVAARLQVPEPLVSGPKRSRLAPPIGVELVVAREKLERLGAILGRWPPLLGAGASDIDDRAGDTDASVDTAHDRLAMLWATTSLLLEAFDVLDGD